jgi:hypothetical protein
MSKNWIAPYKAADGCVYFLNAKTEKIQKISDVEHRQEMPPDALTHFGNMAAVFAGMWDRFKPRTPMLTQEEITMLREEMDRAFEKDTEKKKGREDG